MSSLSDSLVKRSSGIICCSKGRGHCSSHLVRYIPRKAVKNEEDGGTSLPSRYLEQKHIGPESSVGRFEFHNEPNRSILNVDSKCNDACPPSDVNNGLNLVVEEDIEGDTTDVDDEFIEEPDKAVVEDNSNRLCGIPSGRSRQDVQNSAIELLASRAFTSMVLRKKLQGKQFQHETIDAVITDFQSRGLINDFLYAETCTRSSGLPLLGPSPNQTSTIQESNK